MGTVTHTFVSGIADGGDATLVRPSNWNASHTTVGLGPDAYILDGLTLADGQFLLQLGRIQLTSTNRLTMQGATAGTAARVVTFGFTDTQVYNIIGFPFRPTQSFRIPPGYANRWMGRLIMSDVVRGILEGDAEAKLFDDLGPSRAVLTGRG